MSLPEESNFVITPQNAADSAANGLLVTGSSVEGEVGKGELNNAESWDDFPNGRFGDYKSPAFGDPNPWGTSTVSVSLHPTFLRVMAVVDSRTAQSSTRTVGIPQDRRGHLQRVPALSPLEDIHDTLLS